MSLVDASSLADAVSRMMVDAADEYAEMTDGMWICHYGTERFAQCHVAHQLSKEYLVGSKLAAVTIEQNIQSDFCIGAFGSADIKKQLVDSRYFKNNSDIDIVLWERGAENHPVAAVELKSYENVEPDIARLYNLLLTRERPKNTLTAAVVGGYFYSKSGTDTSELQATAEGWINHQKAKYETKGLDITLGRLHFSRHTHDEYHKRDSVLSAYVLGLSRLKNFL